MNIPLDSDGLIPLFPGNVSKKRDFWQLDRVGREYGCGMSCKCRLALVDYYFRCPYCGLLQKATVTVNLSKTGIPVGGALQTDDSGDCIVCPGCLRHYFVHLRGILQKAVEESKIQ